MNEIQETLSRLRQRVSDLRNAQKGNVSIHILSIEICVCLVEFSLNTNPRRAIQVTEEQWFNAGRFVELVLINSEWQDIINLYYNLVEYVENNNYFRF